jgi:acyl-CoA thioester hydrolase
MPPPENRIRVPVRWRDLDMLGHVNQSVYHEMLEEGRAGLVQQLQLGFSFVMARIELDYRSEIRKDHGEVEIVSRVGSVGRSSFVLEHEMLVGDGVVAATGNAVLVVWDAEARGSRPLTGDERARLSS